MAESKSDGNDRLPMTPFCILLNDEVDRELGNRYTGLIGYEYTLGRDLGWHRFYTGPDERRFGMWINVVSFHIFKYEDGNRILEKFSCIHDIETQLDSINVRCYGTPRPTIIPWRGYIHPTSASIQTLLQITREWELMISVMRKGVTSEPSPF